MEELNEHDALQAANTNASTRSRHVPKWYKVRLFRGMVDDVKRRAPFYWSDWTDAWDYRVVPATIYMYFAKYVVTFYLGGGGRISLVPRRDGKNLLSDDGYQQMANHTTVYCLRWPFLWICKFSLN